MYQFVEKKRDNNNNLFNMTIGFNKNGQSHEILVKWSASNAILH